MKTTYSTNSLLIVIVLSFFTYMYNYASPAALFWDENYHIASAQKYIHGVYFMEPHPPLGKMMIALGAKLITPNQASDQFLDTDYGKDLPAGFSFAGYRFFPTLFAWLLAPLFFLIFWRITKHNTLSVLLSFLYIFDNALIVHQRSAMLESTLHFFIVAMILLWLMMIESIKNKQDVWKLALYCGMTFGAVITTKANGLIMILLWPAILYYLWPSWRKVVSTTASFIVGTLIVFCGVWYLHFAIGTQVRSTLPDQGYYQASTVYKSYLQAHSTRNPLHFPVMLADSLAFLPHYAKGVPALNLCKTNENGSPWFYWPVGGRSINYRWETPGGTSAYKYLYLQANPVIWFIALIGFIGGASLLIASLFLPLQKKLENPILLATFVGLYGSYMATMATIDRVMYLYHYFVPLIFTFILCGLFVQEIKKFGSVTIKNSTKVIGMMCLCIAIFCSYQFYRPLSNYEPIADDAFTKRALLPVWDLKCVKCQNTRYLHPTTCGN